MQSTISEFSILSQILPSQLTRNAATGIVEGLQALDAQLTKAQQEYRGERLTQERQKLTTAFLTQQDGLVQHARQLRQKAARLVPEVKHSFSRDDLAEIRAVLRPGIMCYGVDGMPQYDTLKVKTLLDSAIAQGRLNYAWAILEAPEGWLDATTKADALTCLAHAAYPQQAAEAQALLNDAGELETQFNRLKLALAA
jgi:hypothetical protein